MVNSKLIDTIQRARSNKSFAIIEGVQALKHAIRFKAEISEYITCDIDSVKQLLNELANDITHDIFADFTEVSEETFAKLSRNPHRTKVMALAKRRDYQLSDVSDAKPIVFLENPKDLENIGAVIRAAAAADAGAVVITGNIDIWHPAVIRGAAGLHWALPVFDSRHPELDSGSISGATEILKRVQNDRKVVALDPTGEGFNPESAPKSAILVFGTERHGISKELLNKSDQILRLPMREGVSSLNLATSVAATLYQL